MNSPENPVISSQIAKEPMPPTGNVKYIKLDNTTFEVVSNYIGKYTLLDIVKNAIRQDVESGNY
jgi:hypothetical protein